LGERKQALAREGYDRHEKRYAKRGGTPAATLVQVKAVAKGGGDIVSLTEIQHVGEDRRAPEKGKNYYDQ